LIKKNVTEIRQFLIEIAPELYENKDILQIYKTSASQLFFESNEKESPFFNKDRKDSVSENNLHIPFNSY